MFIGSFLIVCGFAALSCGAVFAADLFNGLFAALFGNRVDKGDHHTENEKSSGSHNKDKHGRVADGVSEDGSAAEKLSYKAHYGY